MNRKRLSVVVFIVLMMGMLPACAGGPSPSATSPTSIATYSRYQLEYHLLAKYPDFFWCDPYLYPIGRPEQEQEDAQAQFPAIQANREEFSAILEKIGLAEKTIYSDNEKLIIFREHNLLARAVTLTLAGNIFNFIIRTGENEGLQIEGTITSSGKITVMKQEPSFNTCPICLTKGTLIDTPCQPISVESLQPGMVVWTVDMLGNRIAAPIIKVSSTPVPALFSVVKVSLEDGRSVTVSPGHPTADKRALSDYRVGDNLDGSSVVKMEVIFYEGGITYDLLPSGGTGLYWANSVLLGSTLSK